MDIKSSAPRRGEFWLVAAFAVLAAASVIATRQTPWMDIYNLPAAGTWNWWLYPFEWRATSMLPWILADLNTPHKPLGRTGLVYRTAANRSTQPAGGVKILEALDILALVCVDSGSNAT